VISVFDLKLEIKRPLQTRFIPCPDSPPTQKIQISENLQQWRESWDGTDLCAPGSAWLEGTPAMDLGHVNVLLKWMYLYVGSVLINWNGYYD